MFAEKQVCYLTQVNKRVQTSEKSACRRFAFYYLSSKEHIKLKDKEDTETMVKYGLKRCKEEMLLEK